MMLGSKKSVFGVYSVCPTVARPLRGVPDCQAVAFLWGVPVHSVTLALGDEERSSLAMKR